MPLLSLFLSALVEMTHISSSGAIDNLSIVRSTGELSQAERERAAVYGQRIIHDLFEQGKEVSPYALHIDELDILA